MAGALQESKRSVHGGGQTGEQQASNWAAAKAEQQADNQEEQPETEAVELGNPTEA